MCQFFSFVTNPVDNPGWYYYFDWQYRKANLDDEGVDSHSHICAHFNLDEDRCNKYEFNPLTNKFEIDMINSERNDSEAAEKWVKRLDFKTVIEPLIVKPIVHPFELPEVTEVTAEHIQWLREWASVWSLVWSSVRSLVWSSVGSSVGSSVWSLVWSSVGYSVWAYFSSFFAINFKHDYSSAAKLWESGLVPSFDGKVWRLHTGKDAHVVYEWTPEKERE
ncbi:MAG: hypothetical protein WC910_10300 [Bacteroidales bacterium]|jgi:hypothetical protein